jgi:hypothetical protein
VGVFDIGAAAGAVFRASAIAAAHELGVVDALRAPRTFAELCTAIGIARGMHRVAALVAALVHEGVLVRAGECIALGEMPERPEVVGEGWGRLAEVIRTNRPLPLEPDPRGYHAHLVRAGGGTARELAPLLGAGRLLDLGGGAGTYTAAVLDVHPAATATLVDAPEVIPLAREHLARFGERVQLVAGDARTAALGAGHTTALLANLLHLHDEATCAELCAVAARAVAPGGQVVVLDLDAATPEGVWFALNMALFTDGGGVYPTHQLHGWMEAAGVADLVEHRLSAAPAVVVLVGTRLDVPWPRHEQ